VDAGKLARMANQIAAFFDAEPDRAAARAGVATHLARFWDPRMRRALLAWVDETGGPGLAPTVAEAIAAHRAQLTPSDR
jgi:formate dehydrogenase subunit delta